VHVLLALKPTQSIATVVRQLKGGTSITLFSQFPELRVWLRGNLMWDERYAVETVSGPRVERLRTRLRALHGTHEELAATG
jgi:REP element-mobilizing transposase RayT